MKRERKNFESNGNGDWRTRINICIDKKQIEQVVNLQYLEVDTNCNEN